jgi:hypothetical protein
MKTCDIRFMNFAKLIDRFRVEKARGFRLSDFDPADTCGLDIGKATAKDMIADGLRHLTAMQEKLYAQNRWALLIILQAWTRPAKMASSSTSWPVSIRSAVRFMPRFNSIRAFERHLALNGTLVLKFHLRLSRQEQRRRLLARLDEPAKRWKFSMDDVADSKLWGRYMEAYEDAIRNTATAHAPWFVVLAHHKWFAWLMVAAVVADAMARLDLRFPAVKGKALAKLEKYAGRWPPGAKGLITRALEASHHLRRLGNPTRAEASRCSSRSFATPIRGRPSTLTPTACCSSGRGRCWNPTQATRVAGRFGAAVRCKRWVRMRASSGTLPMTGGRVGSTCR